MPGSPASAHAAGTIDLDGSLTVRRLGFGAGNIGGATDPQAARAVLRRAVELGVNLVDTADSYGPGVSEELIAEALRPYPDDLVIATKAGFVRPPDGGWRYDGSPDHLRAACEGSLRRLHLEQIPLYQLHSPDPNVPVEDSVGALAALQAEGKVRHIGVSNVSADQLDAARRQARIVSVQNRYNLGDRSSEVLVDRCEDDGIAFMPWEPLQDLDRVPAVTEIARNHDATPRQVALAWMLARSPAMLLIPGTTSVAHLEANVAAAALELDPDEVATLTSAAGA